MEAGGKHKGGFTLIELALVLVVLSLLVAGVASVVTQNIRRAKAAELQSKLDAIETALLDFRQRNGRLPCPADGTLAVNTQYFGVETIPAGDCTNGSSYTSGNSPSNTQSADFYDGINTTAGIVPVKTLGLPDAAAFDPWGGAFFYAVDKRITGINAFAAYLVTDTGIGSITVNDGAGNARVTQAIALVMSFGEDGHGAYQFGGGRKSSGSTNLNEQTNCHCNSSATAQTFNATFVQQTAATTNNADPLNIFDDVLRYYVRSSFLSATDISPR